MQQEYYQELYQTDNIRINESYFSNLQLPQLNEKEKQMLAADISDQEIKSALWKLKKDKATGTQGFPPKFFRKFWDEIEGMFTQIIKEASKNGFTLTERRGIISLIEKAGKR